MLRYEKFRTETVPELNGWDAVQASADQIGLSVRIAKPDMTVHPAVENFFDGQEKEVWEEYESGQTDSLYRKIKAIPCKTVYVDGLVREMEEKIGMTQKDNQEALLQKFLEEIKDCKQSVAGLYSVIMKLKSSRRRIRLCPPENLNIFCCSMIHQS